MGKSCCVNGCKNRFSKGSGISFHRFPVDEDLKLLWIQALQRTGWQPSQYTWICGNHFQNGRPSHISQHPDYIPNIDLFPTKPVTSMSIYQKRKQAAMKRKAERAQSPSSLLAEVTANANQVLDFSVTGPNIDSMMQELLPCGDSSTAELEVLSDLESDELMALRPGEQLPDITGPMDLDFAIPPDEGSLSSSVVQGPSAPGFEELLVQLRECEEEKLRMATQLAVQLGSREQEKHKLQAQLRAAHHEIQLLQGEKTVLQDLRQKEAAYKAPPRNEVMSDSFLDDPDRCSYYTGLPNSETVSWVFSLVLPGINCKSKIAPIKQLLLVLIKIKLDLQSKDLAYRFNTSTSTVTRVIDSWLPEMGKKLGGLIRWPNESDIKSSMPQCFEIPKYKNTVVIIDLIEILTKKWGSKNEMMLKVLVGFTPNGTISYLSQCYECDADEDSEFKLGEDFLCNIKTGNVVLADKKFDATELTDIGAELVCPPFSESKQKLSEADNVEGKKILDVRSHVKKVIKRMKMFRMLASGVMPHANVKHANFLIHACAGLINLNPPFTQ